MISTESPNSFIAAPSHLYIMCGHYEGVDQRVLDEIVDEEISIGDYVLTGGELGALVLIDCVSRLCPGALHMPPPRYGTWGLPASASPCRGHRGYRPHCCACPPYG